MVNINSDIIDNFDTSSANNSSTSIHELRNIAIANVWRNVGDDACHVTMQQLASITGSPMNSVADTYAEGINSPSDFDINYYYNIENTIGQYDDWYISDAFGDFSEGHLASLSAGDVIRYSWSGHDWSSKHTITILNIDYERKTLEVFDNTSHGGMDGSTYGYSGIRIYTENYLINKNAEDFVIYRNAEIHSSIRTPSTLPDLTPISGNTYTLHAGHQQLNMTDNADTIIFDNSNQNLSFTIDYITPYDTIEIRGTSISSAYKSEYGIYTAELNSGHIFEFYDAFSITEGGDIIFFAGPTYDDGDFITPTAGLIKPPNMSQRETTPFPQPNIDNLSTEIGGRNISIEQISIEEIIDPDRGILSSTILIDGHEVSGVTTTLKRGWEVATMCDSDGDGRNEIFFFGVDHIQDVGSGYGATWEIGESGSIESTQFHISMSRSGWNVAGATNINSNSGDEIIWQNHETGQKGIWTDTDQDGRMDFGYFLTDLGSNNNESIIGTSDIDNDNNREILLFNRYTQEGRVMEFYGEDSSGAHMMNIATYDNLAFFETDLNNYVVELFPLLGS